MTTLTIGQVAKQTDTGVETIRFYERKGLLPDPPRSPSGYRLYTAETSRRLRFIQRAKTLGFTLSEIRELMTLSQDGSKASVKQITRDKIQDIQSRIRDLTRIMETLTQLESQCSGKGNTEGCPIIRTLNNDETG